MTLSPGARFGPYEVLGPLGAGGMGEVHRARDTRLGREVAIKVLPATVAADRERLARFEREAQVLASLNHPGVAAIYGVEDAGGTPALVLELVEGPTLADRIAQGPIPPDEAVPIARQIAEALEYAHERGVIHRDLKPANVKLDAEGRAKILDFGLAKAIAGDPSAAQGDPSFSPTLTSLGTVAGVLLGTAAYMSPEQARGSTVDRRADIWAFGAVLWEMLTGKRAFEGETISDTLAAVLRAPADWDGLPQSTPRKVRRLLERCLERDPKKRLRDIGEARILLEAPGDEPAAAPATLQAQPAKRGISALVPWALFTLAAAALGVALFSNRSTGVAPTVTRFEFAPPSNLETVSWPRVSPDGRTIAFLGREASGKPAIWLRPIDAFAPYMLAGTEDAGRPFWSPDSRHLAFFRGNQLLKVPAAGGPAQLICEAETGADGSWGAGGTILFDGALGSLIRRCAAGGGMASEVDQPDREDGGTQHAWPWFLPDGKHYLLRATASGGTFEIHVAALGEAGSKALVPADSRAEYANGYLVYVLQDTLVAQAFDEERLATVGDPLPLASGVAARNPGEFSVSANGVLVYRAVGEAAASRLVWLDRTGKELEAVGPPGGYREVTLSPDGSRLAYVLNDGRQDDIWVRDLRRDVATRLTSDSKSDVLPVWSPDGAKIAFSSDRTGRFAAMAKSSSGTGSEQTLLANAEVAIGVTDWSRDGRLLALTWYAPGKRPDIRILPVGATGETQVYLDAEQVAERIARFSPDGRWIAYESNESGRFEIYVQPYPASGEKWTVSSEGGLMAAWRGDGRELFYCGLDDTLYAVPVKLGQSIEIGVPKALFTRPLQTAAIQRRLYDVSADGERFLVNAALEARAAVPFSVTLNWPGALAKP